MIMQKHDKISNEKKMKCFFQQIVHFVIVWSNTRHVIHFCFFTRLFTKKFHNSFIDCSNRERKRHSQLLKTSKNSFSKHIFLCKHDSHNDAKSINNSNFHIEINDFTIQWTLFNQQYFYHLERLFSTNINFVFSHAKHNFDRNLKLSRVTHHESRKLFNRLIHRHNVEFAFDIHDSKRCQLTIDSK